LGRKLFDDANGFLFEKVSKMRRISRCLRETLQRFRVVLDDQIGNLRLERIPRMEQGEDKDVQISR